MSRLTIRRGPQPGKTFELLDEVITIGSGSKNTISILDNDVSREHCKLVRANNGYELHDLDSRRGTFVSGLRVKNGWVLKTGNIIELGENVTLEFQWEAPANAVPSQSVNGATPSSLPAASGGLLKNLQTPTDRPDPAKGPVLVVMDGERAGQRFPLKNPNLTMGRDLNNDVVLADAEVSRVHARLTWADGTYTLEDTGSTNGTEVNGERIPAKKPIRLKPEDKIVVSGRIELLYTFNPESLALPERGKNPAAPGVTGMLRQTTTTENPTTIKPTSRLGTGLKPGALNDHVLIAYTRDMWEPVVARMIVALQDARQRPWVDQYLNEGSEDWMAAVDQAFAECWMAVVVVSKPALDSKYIQAAFRFFHSRKKPLVLYVVDKPAALPAELASARAIRHEPLNPTYSFDELIIEVKSRKRG
jgi:pSer/pThr/pTyr-binding forkhead associated (FHA) protein